MKKITLVILTLSAMFLGTNGFAQGKYGADSAKCVTNLSFYKEYFKQKNYDEALPSWRQAYHFCPPTANQTMLIDGTTLIRHLLQKNARNAAYRKALVDSLMTLHETRANNYPSNAQTTYNNMGQDLHNYVKDNNRRLYDGFEFIIGRVQEKVRPTTLLYDLQAAIDANDVDGMKTKMEALTNAFYPISTRIYQEAQAAQGGAGAQGFDPNNMGGMGFDSGSMGGASNVNNDGTVDADYEVVDDE